MATGRSGRAPERRDLTILPISPPQQGTAAAHELDPLVLAPTRRQRALSLLKLVLFIACARGLIVLGMRVFKPRVDFSPTGSITGLLRYEAIHAAGVMVATAIMLAVWREPLTRAGLGVRRPWDQLALGFAVGLGIIAGIIAILAIGGAYSPGKLLLSPAEILRYGFLHLLTMCLLAIHEEGSLRGYPLVQLSRAISFWPAMLVSSAVFAAEHRINQGETAIGLWSVAAFAWMFAYSFKRSGALYYAWGLHAGTNFAQTFVFGTMGSGMRFPNGMRAAEFSGPAWLTGGTVGPEGSVLIFPLIAAAAWIAHSFLKPGDMAARWRS